MLIVPFDRKIDWSNAPLITVVLVLINVFVFFVIQASEQGAQQAALSYYFESDLYPIESEKYQAYREQQDVAQAKPAPALEAQEQPKEALLFEMLYDKTFMAQLRAGHIITEDDPNYWQWHDARARFEAKLASVVWYSHGLKPGAVEYSDLFTHMFLHASVMHLVGNMFILFAVGFMVEAALGRWLYLTVYLLAGLGSAGLDIALNAASITPTIGASGAIAGLMGLYAVLFGFRRVRFFFFIYVYFDYIKAPAIVLLVFWLGNEIVQQLYFSQSSNVNYLAHIGGLISGAGLAFALKRGTALVNEAYLDEKHTEAVVDARYASIDRHIKALDFSKAAELLGQLYRESPQDTALLWRLHDNAKHQADSILYHQSMAQLIALPDNDTLSNTLVVDAYKEYLKRARPKVRLSKTAIESMLRRLSAVGELDEAQKLLAHMLKNAAAFDNLPHHILLVAGALLRAGQRSRGLEYLTQLRTRYPESQEAQHALALIKT